MGIRYVPSARLTRPHLALCVCAACTPDAFHNVCIAMHRSCLAWMSALVCVCYAKCVARTAVASCFVSTVAAVKTPPAHPTLTGAREIACAPALGHDFSPALGRAFLCL